MNISQMQALSGSGYDYGLIMGCLTLEVNVYQASYVGCLPVLKERDARGRFICVQCVLNALVL